MTVIDWILTRKCNLNCFYCLQGTDTRHEPCTAIDTSFLKLAVPGQYAFHLTGGEPLLVPNIGEICSMVAATSNHLSLNTNLTIDPTRVIESIEPKDVSFINASVHYPYRKKSISKYVEHYKLLREKGFFVVGSCVMEPESFNDIVDFIDNVRTKHGIMIFPKMMRGLCGKQSYPEDYSEKQIFELNRLNTIACAEAESFNPSGWEQLALHSPSIDSWGKHPVGTDLSCYCFDGIQAIHLDTNGDWIKCDNECIGNAYRDGFLPLNDLKECCHSIKSGSKTYCTKTE